MATIKIVKKSMYWSGHGKRCGGTLGLACSINRELRKKKPSQPMFGSMEELMRLSSKHQ